MNLSYVISWIYVQHVCEELYWKAWSKAIWANPMYFPAKRLIKEQGMKAIDIPVFRAREHAESVCALESMLDILNDSGKTETGKTL